MACGRGCDDAESLKLITFVVFLFWVIENCNSALAEKSPEVHSGDGSRPGMQIWTRPIHLIWHPHTTTSSSKWRRSFAGRHCDSDDDVIAAVNHFLEVQDSSFYKEGIYMLYSHCTKWTQEGSVLCQFIWNWLRLPEPVDLSIIPYIYTHIPVQIQYYALWSFRPPVALWSCFSCFVHVYVSSVVRISANGFLLFLWSTVKNHDGF